MDVLANWLWQGLAVALVATVALRVSRAIGATARYRLWWAVMGVVLALPLAPAASGLFTAGTQTGPALPAVIAAAEVPRVTIPALPPWVTLVLASMWAVWTLAMTVRIAAAMRSLTTARRRVRPFPADRELRLDNWMAVRSRGRKAALVLSNDVRLAAVLGGRAPAIAISPALADALDDRDLDRIVLHEWAHVQRYDDGARLLQLAVRAIAGFHPAVWWIDRQIHIDRETACDDWAVNLTGSAKRYAASLTRLAGVESSGGAQILLPAALSSPELTRRVVRLLDARRSTSVRQFGVASALMLAAVLGTAIAVAGVPLVAVESLVGVAAPMRPASSWFAAVAAPAQRSETAVDRRRDVPARVRAERQSERRARPSILPVDPSLPADPTREAPVQAPVEAPPTATLAAAPSSPAVRTVGELPGVHTPIDIPQSGSVQPAAATPDAPARSPWAAASDAGVNVGRGSQKAAVATAGFFSKLGKSIARSF